MTTKNERIADLEAEIRDLRNERKALRAELDEAHDLVARMREHVEDAGSMIESWVEAFDMEMDEHGLWVWPRDKLVEAYNELFEKYDVLVKDWNRFVPIYNKTVAPLEARGAGRRLEASTDQVEQVKQHRKEGLSLRQIAEATGLSLRTVRTVLDSGTGKERSKTNELRRVHHDRLAAAEHRAKNKARANLEKRINSMLKSGSSLVTEAKGLGARK